MQIASDASSLMGTGAARLGLILLAVTAAATPASASKGRQALLPHLETQRARRTFQTGALALPRFGQVMGEPLHAVLDRVGGTVRDRELVLHRRLPSGLGGYSRTIELAQAPAYLLAAERARQLLPMIRVGDAVRLLAAVRMGKQLTDADPIREPAELLGPLTPVNGHIGNRGMLDQTITRALQGGRALTISALESGRALSAVEWQTLEQIGVRRAIRKHREGVQLGTRSSADHFFDDRALAAAYIRVAEAQAAKRSLLAAVSAGSHAKALQALLTTRAKAADYTVGSSAKAVKGLRGLARKLGIDTSANSGRPWREVLDETMLELSRLTDPPPLTWRDTGRPFDPWRN